MNLLLPILFHLLLPFLSSGQKMIGDVESTKGQWDFPISDVQSIDTMGKGCLGNSIRSLNLILKTNCSQLVKAIQPGKVVAVHNYEDSAYWILVRSGDYFLVYSCVSNPKVEKGDLINRGIEIGTLVQFGSERDIYSLELMLYKKTKVVNINRWFHWAGRHIKSD